MSLFKLQFLYFLYFLFWGSSIDYKAEDNAHELNIQRYKKTFNALSQSESR